MARFLVKTKERLLKEGWVVDDAGHLVTEPRKAWEYAIMDEMQNNLGKWIDLDEDMMCRSHWTWPKSVLLTKKDIINEFFNT